MDSDGRPTAGARVLVMVLKVPWHPYHSGPALHCRVPSHSERCLRSKSDRHFFVVAETRATRVACFLNGVVVLWNVFLAHNNDAQALAVNTVKIQGRIT